MGVVPSLSYESVEDRTRFFGNDFWAIHDGVHTKTKTEVSLFIFEFNNRSQIDCDRAQTFLRHIRTIRHPFVLQYLDSIADEEKIIIATERVTRFSFRFDDEDGGGKYSEQRKALGIYQIATALDFLNKRCSKIHGNLTENSIFIGKNSDWKLAGFENIFETDKRPPDRVAKNLNVRFNEATPRSNVSDLVSSFSLSTESIENWNLALFSFGCFGRPVLSFKDLRNTDRLPPDLKPAFALLLDVDPTFASGRSIERFLATPYFKAPLVRDYRFLSEISLKQEKEKQNFFCELKKGLPSFTKMAQIHFVLPVLVQAIDQGFSDDEDVLFLVIKISQCMSDEEFKAKVLPIISKLFCSNARLVRINLLKFFPQIIPRIDAETIQKDILPTFFKGFQDSLPIIRETTVKNSPHLAAKLKWPDLSKLLLCLSKMQTDIEADIRFNAVGAISRLATSAPRGERAQLLFKACLAALKDPRERSHVGALRCVEKNISLLSAETLAKKFLPLVGPFSVRKNKEISALALKCIDKIVSVIKSPPDENPEIEQSVTKQDSYGQRIFSFVKNAVMDSEPRESPPKPNISQKTANGPAIRAPLGREEIIKNEIVFKGDILPPLTTNSAETKNKADLIDFSKSDFVACENVFGVWNDFPTDGNGFARETHLFGPISNSPGAKKRLDLLQFGENCEKEGKTTSFFSFDEFE